MELASYGTPVREGVVLCRLCPVECELGPGVRGACGVRVNEGGRLVSLNYARVAAAAVEPVEKKPLYHFHPGSLLLSLGPYGCNLHCAYCQNWRLSQRHDGEGEQLEPAAAVERALAAREADPRVVGLAFTFTEPIIWFEYVRDVARLARPAGLAVVLKTAGYVNPEPLAELLGWADALNVDLKSFRESFYRRVCGASLGPVRRTIETAVRAGRHVEVTTLLVPGRNDDPGELAELCAWLAGLDPGLPLHLPRYYPNWKLDGAPAATEALEAARVMARRYLNYVYVGGTWRPEHATTTCPACGSALVRRAGMRVAAVGLRQGACAACGRRADIRGSVWPVTEGQTAGG